MREDLILLRSSDAGHSHRQKEYDRILPIENNSIRDAASKVLSSGVSSVGRFVKAVVASGDSAPQDKTA